MRRSTLIISALIVFGFSSAKAVTQYSLTDLGNLGGTYITPYAVNNSGQVVGEGDNAGGVVHAFLWSSSTGMTDLGNLGGTYNRAEDINNLGDVVGRADLASGAAHGFSYTHPSGPMVDQNAAMGGIPLDDNIIYAVTDTGKMAGYVDNGAGAVPKYFNGTSWVTLNRGSSGYTGARGVNDLGQIVGFGSNGGQYWANSASAPVNVADLAGGFNSWLDSINNAGQAAGGAGTLSGFSHAISYTFAGGTVDLGTLGGNNSWGYKENQNGDIVGYSEITPGSGVQHAFLYTGGSMYDLNGLVDSSGSGWTLTSVGGISDNGFITGFGLDPFGNSHAFMLSFVPEPSSIAMLFGGLGLLGFVIRRKRS